MADHDPHPCVLVLDDDPATLALEQRALERGGYSVLARRTRDEALDRVLAGGVEVLVIDYRLDGTSTGLDVFRHLREFGQPAPAVLVTSFADESKIIEALRAGIRDVVPKSGDYLEYLPQAVGPLLGTDRRGTQARAAPTCCSSLVDRLRIETQTLETINDVGRQLAAEHDVHVLVQRVMDACTSIVGAQFGRVLLQRRGPGPAVLDAVHDLGRVRERYGEGVVAAHPALVAPIPASTRRSAARTCRRPALRGERAVPRTAGRTSCRCAAISRCPSSRVMDARSARCSSGTPTPAVFHDREARIVEGVAAQASSAIDNARLIDALRTSEDRLRLATEAARQGTWDFNPVTGDLQWSDRCRELFGLSPGAPVSYDVFLQAVHPADRQATDAAVKRALDPDDGAQIFEAEYRVDRHRGWPRALDPGARPRLLQGRPRRALHRHRAGRHGAAPRFRRTGAAARERAGGAHRERPCEPV